MNSKSFSIGSFRIDANSRTFIIAEVAQAHDGSLGMAHAYIDSVAETGADAIKFQTHIAAEESTLDEPFRVKFSQQDATRYDYWKRMEFTEEQWTGLTKHARERDLIFLSSAFSVKAVEMLGKVGMPAWKVGSGEVWSEELLNAMAQNGSPILLSTGMSTYSEIEATVNRIKERGLPFAVFQCTSKYPTSLEEVGLNVIEEIRKRFKCPVGLSDHSGSIFPGLAAMALGVDLLEVHVTFHRRMFGPDVPASVTLDELRLLVEARDAFHRMFSNPVDKDKVAEGLSKTKSLFTKSLATTRKLPTGTVLQTDMLTLKKPGIGIPSTELNNIIGRRLVREVDPKKLLKWDDLE
jgi:N,N'-diacetyllegionaminate synthase